MNVNKYFNVIDIDIYNYEGHIPKGYDLVEYEPGKVEEGMVLNGFDEVGTFIKTNAKHAFVGLVTR